MALVVVEAFEGGHEVGTGLGEELTDAADGEFDRWDGVRDDPIGQPRERLGSWSVRVAQRSRFAEVTANGDCGIERNRPEEGDAELLGEPLAAALTEHGVTGSVGTDGGAHVLDDARNA